MLYIICLPYHLFQIRSRYKNNINIGAHILICAKNIVCEDTGIVQSRRYKGTSFRLQMHFSIWLAFIHPDISVFSASTTMKLFILVTIGSRLATFACVSAAIVHQNISLVPYLCIGSWGVHIIIESNNKRRSGSWNLVFQLVQWFTYVQYDDGTYIKFHCQRDCMLTMMHQLLAQ